MKIKDFIEHLKYGETSSIVLIMNLREGDIHEQEDAQRALISYINLGLINLYSEFDLKTSAAIIPASGSRVLNYSHPAMIEVHQLTTLDGDPLREQTTHDTDDWDYRTVALGSWILREELSEDVVLLYKSGPDPVMGLEDELPIQHVFLEALTMYVAARAYSSVGTSAKGPSNVFIERYNLEVLRLKQQGFATQFTPVGKNIRHKGFL